MWGHGFTWEMGLRFPLSLSLVFSYVECLFLSAWASQPFPLGLINPSPAFSTTPIPTHHGLPPDSLVRWVIRDHNLTDTYGWSSHGGFIVYTRGKETGFVVVAGVVQGIYGLCSSIFCSLTCLHLRLSTRLESSIFFLHVSFFDAFIIICFIY